MSSADKLIRAAARLGRTQVQERGELGRLSAQGEGWLSAIEVKLAAVALSATRREDLAVELAAGLEALLALAEERESNSLLGRALSLLAELERGLGSEPILRRLLGGELAARARARAARILVINPGSTSTKVALFEGLEKTRESEVHLPPEAPDGVGPRTEGINDWLAEQGVAPVDLDAIACRGGFLAPVPGGDYRVGAEMLRDLGQARIQHASSLAVSIGERLAQRAASGRGAGSGKAPGQSAGRGREILLTTSDPVVTDEMELVERITGYVDLKRDGSGAHYLNHKAVWRLLCSMLSLKPEDTGAVTAHIGGGMSVALHRGGRVTALVDAFAGMPSANRSGDLDLPRVIDLLRRDEITLKQLEEIVLKRGGLLSLAGTNDFRALLGFRRQGATEAQQEKIELILDFFARRISAAVLELSADGGPLRYVALTGGLARSGDLVARIRDNLADRLPLVCVPGSVEHESLAAGALRGLLAPELLLDYARERDRLRQRREVENQLLDTVIFERALLRKKPGSPILNLDELVDATCATVERHHAPIIGIVGAENDEAILAAKRANEAGRYRLARFRLIGDYTAINEIAYETDLVLDGENYAIVDSSDPVDDAVRMLEAGELEILMKGSMKTESILRGVFRFLKDSGRLKKGELISHIVVMDIPRRSKLLLVTDAAVNTYPDEEKRARITENALKVARSLHIPRPKVGVISAIESVNPSVESSMEAQRIAARFAGRDDCVVEGPLSFDVAMDPAIAAEKRYTGKVAGTADILVMPDIDAGNVLYKTLTTQSGATCAGVILAGDTPMVLTSRGDTARSKLASISLAVKLYFELRGAKA